MSMCGEIELAQTSTSIYKNEINRLHDTYGHGVRPSWVIDELENLYDNLRRSEARVKELNKGDE
tara:strand:+ start:267 stop:458 length:192 start_codon:yes stop_codon:yes gene_type:complete